jgi:hypothetical protein
MKTNPKFNASGYRDMTAYMAINNIDHEKKYIRTEEKPAENAIRLTSPRIEHIELSKCIPTNYQRLTSPKHVSNIVKHFNEAKLNLLTISLREGKYYIIDGLHRAEALRALRYTHAPCIVLTGMTYEQEADFFRRQNELKRIITTFDDFKAGMEAKDEVCINITKILKNNGFQIGRGGFYKINSIRALYNIVNDYGYAILDDTLFLLANTWNNIPEASSCRFLMGVAEFVSRYGIVADFAERLKDKFAVICYDYDETMRVRGSIRSTASHRKLCQILVEHYNKGLRANSKKRLIWEN